MTGILERRLRPNCRQFNGHWGHVDGFDSTSQRYLLRVFTGQPGAKPKIATWKTGSLLFLWIKKTWYLYIYMYICTYRCIVMYMCTNLYILFEFWDILYWHTYAYSTIVAASIASAWLYFVWAACSCLIDPSGSICVSQNSVGCPKTQQNWCKSYITWVSGFYFADSSTSDWTFKAKLRRDCFIVPKGEVPSEAGMMSNKTRSTFCIEKYPWE